jgi:hypothetical protein
MIKIKSIKFLLLGIVILLLIGFIILKSCIIGAVAKKEIDLQNSIIFSPDVNSIKNPIATQMDARVAAKTYAFAATYMGLNAGTAKIEIVPPSGEDASGGIKLKATIDSSDAISSLYKLKIQAETILNEKNFIPITLFFSQVKNFSKFKRQMFYDYKNKVIKYKEKGYRTSTGDYEKEWEFPFENVWFDELSTLFIFRFLNLTPGSSVEVPVISSAHKYKLKFIIGNYEKIDLPGFGSIGVLKCSIQNKQDPQQRDNGAIEFYISPENDNMPVLVKAKIVSKKIGMGNIKITMVK